MEDGLQHNGYKKDYDSWEIRDYFDGFEDFESFYQREMRIQKMHETADLRWYGSLTYYLRKKNIIPSRKNLYKCWYKMYRMK